MFSYVAYLLTYAHRSVLSIGHQQNIFQRTLFLPTFWSVAKTCQLSLLRPPLNFAMCFLVFIFFSLLGSSSGRVLLHVQYIRDHFLRVCPNHRHFLLLVMSLTGSCYDLRHNSILVTLSIHLMPSIHLGHLLTNV